MQANKNGFFYVLDRATGELLSAKNFTYVNWASGVDMKTGRPDPDAAIGLAVLAEKRLSRVVGRAHLESHVVRSPPTHLVYIPVVDTPSVWVDLTHNGGALKFLDGFYTTNGIFPDDSYDRGGLEAPVRSAARSQGSSRPSAR